MNLSESEKNWLVYFDGSPFGPVSAVEIKKGLQDKKINADDVAIKKGGSKWRHLKDIPLFAYVAQRSPGNSAQIPELPVPSLEEFTTKITPMVSTAELVGASNWSGRRLAIVGGSFVLLGGVGAVAAGVLTSKKDSEKREENARLSEFIHDKNK